MFLEWENNSGRLQIISGKFQNNAINVVKQISLSHVIRAKIPSFMVWELVKFSEKLVKFLGKFFTKLCVFCHNIAEVILLSRVGISIPKVNAKIGDRNRNFRSVWKNVPCASDDIISKGMFMIAKKKSQKC